jgi:hypothetical protein
MIGVLKPLKQVTEFLSQEKHPTIGLIMRMICHLMNQQFITTNEDIDMSKNLKEIIHNELEKRWNTIYYRISNTLLLSIFLDPRVKNFEFIKNLEERERLRKNTLQFTNQLLLNPDIPLSQNTITSNHSYVLSTNPYECIFGKDEDCVSSSNEDVEPDPEVLRYYSELPLPLYDSATNKIADPLLWWKFHQPKYPHLAKLARKFLCINPTSVSPERIFSKSGWIVNKRRTLLKDEHVAMLVFLSSNLITK